VLVVKGSPLQWEELMKCAVECGLDTTKGLSLDVSTRWNSTYLMLRGALYYKHAFLRLKSSYRRRSILISFVVTIFNICITFVVIIANICQSDTCVVGMIIYVQVIMSGAMLDPFSVLEEIL
jgi:hypothetical protein